LVLAQKIEEQFKTRVKRKSRGVKQAGFVVLYKTTMPAVLVETGYLSNATERAFLASDDGQTYLASGIYRALTEYKEEMEKE
jgi:N-acetylmuramoyl-L-alanine amidase